MEKKFYIRKQDCGHWGVFQVMLIEPDMLIIPEVLHIETFEDLLVIWNVELPALGYKS